MKTLLCNPQKIMLKLLVAMLLTFWVMSLSYGQSLGTKPSLAIISIDAKGINSDPNVVRNMVQLELEKTNKYNVMDRYDLEDILKHEDVQFKDCYGKSCLVEKGKLLDVDKMLTGSIELFGDKIVVTLRLIDVREEVVEKVEAEEFLNLQEEIQKMIRISINNLLGIENDMAVVSMLVDYNNPISSPKTVLRLNGPRMGVAYTTGESGERLQAPEKEGGFDMFPVITQFGYQWETQYLSSGNFQALIEFVGLIGGLETGRFVPSLSFMNGFRNSKSGWEIAFGPSFKLVKYATGYYENGHWYLENEWDYGLGENPYELQEQLDSRGDIRLSTNLVIAIGKTFKSGYLNIPVNVYVVPNKKGTIIGTSVGFNISKQRK